MERVTTRLPEDVVAALAELEAELDADRSTVLRRVIRQGLAAWRKERALDKLRHHEITLRTAAALADVSIVEMVSVAATAGIDVGYSASDLERDLRR